MDEDKALLRRLAAALAKDDARAQHLRSTLAAALGPPSAARGGILAALLRAPRVDLDITRERDFRAVVPVVNPLHDPA